MNKQPQFQPPRFSSLRDTQPHPTTWEDIVNEIRGEKHLNATHLYRNICRQLADAIQAKDDALTDVLKLRKNNVKLSQPAFVCSVSLTDGRSARHINGYSCFTMVDVDNINEQDFSRILALVKADPHSMLVYTTLSGHGIRIVARTEGPINSRNFGQVWQTVNDYYARLTGVEIDKQCKNATRMSVICHDPDVVYRPDATAFTSENLHSIKVEQAADTVRRLVEDDGIRYEPGSHNAYVCRCLYWMNRFGVAQGDAKVWALQEFKDYDDTAHTVASIADSCYAQTDEHATCELRKYTKRTNRKKQNTLQSAKATVAEMENFINTWAELRMNQLSFQLEIRIKQPEEDWQRMTDLIENSLWCDMQRAGINTDIFRLHTLLQSNFVKSYHPLKEYLATLPPWDGVTDYIGRVSNMVKCRDTANGHFDFYFRRWFIGMLASALNEHIVNHEILVLLGPQGSFKSSFMENLLPPSLRMYHTTKTNSQRLTKDDLFTMTENLLISLEEIDTMQRAELNQLKAMVTTPFINERPAYGRNKVRRPHVASFCATGNNIQFLTDDTGNRRWLPFEIERIENPWTTPIPYEGMYAQAKHLLDNGFRYWFQESEIEELNARNRRFETPNPARELILSHFRRPGALEKARYITSTQIVARFGASVRLNAVQVGKVLKELGFEQANTHHGRFWLVMDRTSDEMANILPEPCIDTVTSASDASDKS